MSPTFCILLTAFLAVSGSAEGPAPLDASALRAAVSRYGHLLGLKAAADGGVRWERVNPRTGVPFADALPEASAQRVGRFLVKLPADAPEAALVAALSSYLAPRLRPEDPTYRDFVANAPDGKPQLTALGRSALMDILTAEDGLLVDQTRPQASSGSNRRVGPLLGLDSRDSGARGGSLAAAAAVVENAQAFDGARHQVAAFDWAALERETAPRSGLKEFGTSVLQGYSVDREANTVRVLVAANRNVRRDRFKVESEADGAAILREAGLDRALFARHGARVVRAVDNLIAIDVPLPQAAKLGQALGRRGMSSAPARVFKRIGAVASAGAAGPAAALLGGQFSPIPPEALAASLTGGSDEPKSVPSNFDGRERLGADGLWKRGMDGSGATVGIIDSGIDAQHPDFAGRVAGYMDFTEEGLKDPVGHGTHVAGTVGGSGAASDGKFKGMAPGSKLVVAKVFGSKGEASEDVILAAMKWMTESKEKVDVVNMSLGGPGEPNVDPLGSMANRMTVKNNILVVAAAGNDGPGPNTVGAPGNARYVLTVTGVNKNGEFPFFPSRGPVGDGKDGYAKPDVAAVAGDIQLPTGGLWARLEQAARGGLASVGGGAPADASCIYAPGIVSARSSDDPDAGCALQGNPNYRFMTGTSMAAPMASGMAADVVGYVRSQGASARAVEVKAAIVETASDLGKPRELQGAGLVDGGALASTVAERVSRGLPIGNIAYMLALRLTTDDRKALEKQDRYQETALGLLDTKTGHLVNTDREMDAAVRYIRRRDPNPPAPGGAPPVATAGKHDEVPIFRPFPQAMVRPRS
ncbi:MAG: S8 family serine peptidase [Elusimicrobia bacterium]|nr:S8 family serine peptidase [Elusimicrobiota bacterium]